MVSEKAASVKSKADQVVVNGKFAPTVTLITAIIAFSLSLVALLAVGGNGVQQYDLITLNTSTLLQNVIKVSGRTSTPSRSLNFEDERNFIAHPQVTNPAMLRSPVEVRQFPPAPDVGPFFSSVGGGIASAVNPATPTSTGSPGRNGGGGTGGRPLQDIQGLFNNLLGAVAGAAGEEIINVMNSLVSAVLDALGIDDYYSLYMTEFCSGDYTPNYASQNAKRNTTKCTPYDQAIPQSRQTNSTLQLGPTVIDISALNIPAKLSREGSLIGKVIKALFAIEVIGIVAAGLLILLTPLYIFISFFQSSLVRFIIVAFVNLATICFGINAIVQTAIAAVTSVLVNDLGQGLGIEAQKGGGRLALLWVTSVFIGISSTVWFLRWHKERYVRRSKQDAISSRPLVESAKSTYQLSPTMDAVRGERLSSGSDRAV